MQTAASPSPSSSPSQNHLPRAEDLLRILQTSDKAQFLSRVIRGGILYPTVVQIRSGSVLGCVYSNEASLRAALTQGRGIYWSRERDALWVKSRSGTNRQDLLDVSVNCDGSSLLFTVHQHGVFCHLGSTSCFGGVARSRKPLRLGLCSGRSEAAALRALDRIGVRVWRPLDDRNASDQIESHWYSPLHLVRIKPIDVPSFLQLGLVDIMCCYADVVGNVTAGYEAIRVPNHHPINICLVSRPGVDLTATGALIATEYPHLNDSVAKLINSTPKYLTVHGGAESHVVAGVAQAAVTVVDTGDTLLANSLISRGTLATCEMMFYQRVGPDHYPALRRLRECVSGGNTIYIYEATGELAFLSPFAQLGAFRLGISTDHPATSAIEALFHLRYAHRGAGFLAQWGPAHSESHSLWYRTRYLSSLDGNDTPDWPAVRNSCLELVINQMLGFSPELVARIAALTQRGVTQICFHSMRDAFLGIGQDGQGQNAWGVGLLRLAKSA